MQGNAPSSSPGSFFCPALYIVPDWHLMQILNSILAHTEKCLTHMTVTFKRHANCGFICDRTYLKTVILIRFRLGVPNK